MTQPLDSYQDIDLNNLREKCKEILESRKQYLYSQLKLVNNNVDEQTDEDKERYESLCKQLMNLGEEQVALDAPEDNSGLPGSTIEWEPSSGMEKHVPIVFLDIDDDADEYLNNELNISDDYYEDDFESHSSLGTNGLKKWNNEYSRGQKGDNESKTFMYCGQECCLKHEQRDSRYVDLKMVRWNDSNMVEMVSSDEFQVNENEIGMDVGEVETDGKCLI